MRIKTGNLRRKRKLIKNRPWKILEEWSCFVEEYDEHLVYLRMVNANSDNEEFQGNFPKRLFGNIDLKLGLYLNVKVTSHRTILIDPVICTKEQIEEGEKRTNELLKLLEELRLE